MKLELTREQAQEVELLLGQSLGDLSHEIAATDNAHYRAGLVARRHRLEEVTGALGRLLLAEPAAPAEPRELVRELTHPGD
jgi:hypothetical protein